MKVVEKSSQDLKKQKAPLSRESENPMTGVNISVVGGGFVGLVTAAGFAQFGHSVVCIDKNLERVKMLSSGKIPFYEPELENLVKLNIEKKRLSFSSDLEMSFKGQKAIFITVGTPNGGDGRTDLTALDEVLEVLSVKLESDQVVVLKSTVPLGTGKYVQSFLSQNGRKKPCAVVNNPEFLREGSAINDFFRPQRIVLGGEVPEAVEIVANIYKFGMTQSVPFFVTNNETAEMIKYASNAFLATKVGYVNELAGLCDLVGVNVLEVARAIGLDPRIGSEFLEPGPGWGGSCFKKDLKEFTGLAEANGYSLLITQAVLSSNKRQHALVVDKVKNFVGVLEGSRIGVLGLTFKAETSDLRDSPAVEVVKLLIDAGANVSAYDPKAKFDESNILPELELAESPYDIAKDSDCLVILTEWREFQLLDFKKISEIMKHPNLVDARNLLPPELLSRYGINYTGMGQT